MIQDASDLIEVSGSGLSVRKRLDRERFKHLGVVYQIRSNSPDRIHLRIIDTVPASIPVGFHPEYHGSNWTMGERTLVFEQDLDPGADVVTLYGLGTGADDSVERFRTEPIVEIRSNRDRQYSRLDPAAGTVEDSVATDDDSDRAASQIAELATALEARESDQRQHSPPGSDVDSPFEAHERLEAEDTDLLSALDQSIERLESIAESVSAEGAAVLGSGQPDRSARSHVEAILSHSAQLREELRSEPTDSEPAPETTTPRSDDVSETSGSGSDSEPSGTTTPQVEQPQGSAAGRSRVSDITATGPRPGYGIPLFWLVSLIGFWTLLLGTGIVGGAGQDGALMGVGAIVALAGAFGWLYPEDKLPYPTFPIAIVLMGLAILAHPFVFGNPTASTGVLTLVAGIMITMIPILVENRRWQLLGLAAT